MPFPVLAAPPARATAGDTLRFRIAAPGAPPAPGRTAVLALDGVIAPEGEAAAVEAVEGAAWQVTIPAALTAAAGAGVLRWRLVVADVDDRLTAARGEIVLAAADEVTADEQLRDQIRARIAAHVAEGVDRYRRGDVEVFRTTLADLRRELRAVEARIRAARTGSGLQTLAFGFGGAGLGASGFGRGGAG